MFSDFYREVSELSAMKTSACLSKLNSIPSQKLFLRKRNQAISCLFFLEFRRKLSEILANYLGASLSELPCKCPDESFGKKSWIIYFLLWWWAEEIRLLARKNGRFVKTAFYFSTRTFWEKEIDMFYFFLELEQTFLPVPAENLGQICRNCIVGGQRRLFTKQVFLGRLIVCLVFDFGFLA